MRVMSGAKKGEGGKARYNTWAEKRKIKRDCVKKDGHVGGEHLQQGRVFVRGGRERARRRVLGTQLRKLKAINECTGNFLHYFRRG